MHLTIVGFHHRHECAASPVMACQRIFFTPLSFCLSFMPSFSPPSRLVFTCSGYGLLYRQTHSLHSVLHALVHIYIHLDETNVNTHRTFAIIMFSAYQVILSCAYLFSSTFSNSTFSFFPAVSPPYVRNLSPPVPPSIMVLLSGSEGC